MFDINKATDLELATAMDECQTRLQRETMNIMALRQEIQSRKPKLSEPINQPKE